VRDVGLEVRRKLRLPDRALRSALLLLVLGVAACSQRKAYPSSIGGIGYTLELAGPYTRALADERTNVWLPSDDQRPIVQIVRLPRARREGPDGPAPCLKGDDNPVQIADSTTIYVRKGEGVGYGEGMAVKTSRCVPPGQEALFCLASYDDGKMSGARKDRALAACSSLTVP
jgi:hypothetical protein